MSERRALSLLLEDVRVHYGLSQALDRVSIQVPASSVMAILGANGAGKSSLLKAITGLVSVSGGSVQIGEITTTNWPPRKIAELGVALVPEGRRVFRSLTVEENLLMGSYVRRRNEGSRLREIYQHFPALAQRRRQSAGTLSGGEQQMLAIGRALMVDPGLLLLDEPSLGLAPRIVGSVFSSLADLRRDKDLTIVIIEQNARQALRLADEAVLLETGRVVASGTPEEIAANDQLEAAYFGPR